MDSWYLEVAVPLSSTLPFLLLFKDVYLLKWRAYFPEMTAVGTWTEEEVLVYLIKQGDTVSCLLCLLMQQMFTSTKLALRSRFLYPQIFNKSCQEWDRTMVVGLATHLERKFPVYMSPVADPMT